MSITSTGLSDYELGTASSTSIAGYEPGAALESSTSVANRLDRSRDHRAIREARNSAPADKDSGQELFHSRRDSEARRT
jgi:hypothetical protein